MGGLVKGGPGQFVAAAADAVLHLGLPARAAPSVSGRDGPHVARASEAVGRIEVARPTTQDRDGAVPLLRVARRLFPFVTVIFADGAYQGQTTAEGVARTGRWRLEIVKRSDGAGFGPLPKR